MAFLFGTEPFSFTFFFFNDTATTEIYTLSLHDALPICPRPGRRPARRSRCPARAPRRRTTAGRQHDHRRTPRPSMDRRTPPRPRSEEHTSELQSRLHLVCRLLLAKKKKAS